MSNEKIGGVAETMLQTLYARAKESKKPNHKIYDEKAINIDLPVTMEVRERYIGEGKRVTNISSSAMDEGWTEQIEAASGTFLVIIEGLSMYLTEEDVKQILSIIDRHFLHVTVFMEILNPKFVKKNMEKSIQQSGAVFTWGTRSGEELVRLNPAFHWLVERSLVEGMVEIAPIYKVRSLTASGAVFTAASAVASFPFSDDASHCEKHEYEDDKAGYNGW